MNGKQWFILVCVGIVIFVIWSTFGGYEALSTSNGKKVEAIAALFSGFAFLGMIITLIMQKEELELQRKELEQTREELARTAKANEDAARIAEQNLKAQKMIADENIVQIKNQIKAQAIIARIEHYYKIAEFTYSRDAAGKIKYFREVSSEINNLIEKLDNFSCSSLPPSTSTT